jgi:hypothetical protein
VHDSVYHVCGIWVIIVYARGQTQGSLEARLWISCVDVETRFTVVGLLCLTQEERLKNGCCLYLIEALTLGKNLKEGFIKRSYPSEKILQNTNIILSFRQNNNEHVATSWKGIKVIMLRTCPSYGLDEWTVLHSFYSGLNYCLEVCLTQVLP